ncbi:AsmA family protein [uncultured Sphingomonas sp.]|uniref:AsmA family protein n=1 Tax=uncultured Sphingomonas sp. TaxID=158754 RepID=UPI00374A02ED
MALHYHRWLRWTAILLILLAISAIALLAAFPVAPFRERAERTLSERFGRPVTIGALERTPAFSFTPTIRIRDVRIPQPAWAGAGDLARIATLDMQIRSLGLLTGRVDPKNVTASDVRLDLVRTAEGRTNWDRPGGTKDAGSGSPFRLDGLTVRDAVVRYRDGKQDRQFTIAVTSDATGFAARGQGVVRGAAVRVAATGAAITAGDQPWPFSVRLDGPSLAMTAQGRMDTPLDTERMTLAVTARASSLKLIDAVIEAGLFGTQPVQLSADVRHDGPKWQIENLRGRIGRSEFTGKLAVDKTSGRTVLNGDIRAPQLDFEDLADDAGLAKAAALQRAVGPRVVPNTRVDIGKITSTDGRITFRIDRILSREPSVMRSASGTLVLDRQLLTVEPLRIGLIKGAITGKAVVDQRGGRPAPTVTLSLDLSDSSIAALAGSGDVTGRLAARVRLSGVGETIRSAVGRSSGQIGIVARDGALPAKMAAMLGFDAGRAMTADEDARARLRCAVLRLDVTGGRGRFDPLIVDTSASQTRGTGGVVLPAETIAAKLTGAPKHNSLLRIPGSVLVSGTLSSPQVVVPQETKSVGNILKGLGRAITGKQGPVAGNADCDALSRRAIGR